MLKSRIPTYRSFLIFILIVVAAFVYRQWIYEEEIVLINGNVAQAIDGDSFRIGKEEFRIYGVDAPEYRQTCKDETGAKWSCGKVARNWLDKVLREEDHSCVVRARDQFGRLVVLCKSEAGADLSAKLVAAGLAVSGTNFDEIIYSIQEGEAQKSKRGIWKGEFSQPSIWRAENPRN
ncbi:MAG: hypothetical protein Pars2KO_31830 [Parasphingorhabdus sp.]